MTDINRISKVKSALIARVDYAFSMKRLNHCLLGWMQGVMDGSMPHDPKYVNIDQIAYYYDIEPRVLHAVGWGYTDSSRLELHMISRDDAINLLSTVELGLRFVWPESLESQNG